MSGAVNFQVDMFDAAPAKRVLRGDKKKKLEVASHVIEFPGGAVEVSRLDDGNYWAHIIVNRGQALDVFDPGMQSAVGEVVSSRVDWAERRTEAIPGLPDQAKLTQIAVLIRPQRSVP